MHYPYILIYFAILQLSYRNKYFHKHFIIHQLKTNKHIIAKLLKRKTLSPKSVANFSEKRLRNAYKYC